MNDWKLLRRYIEEDSQEAFATLSRRYVNLVYSVCRRELTDAQLAEDVTQTVFLILAKKAPTLRRSVILSSWLFQTARFAAQNARTREKHRTAYEQKAVTAMEQSLEAKDVVWQEIEPLLNQSLAVLKNSERDCVLLRYYQRLSFAEVGAALGLSEEAARKRVGRTLEKMRVFLTKEGVIIPSLALSGLLSAHAVKAAPPYVAEGITKIMISTLPGPISTQLEGALHAMKVVKLKIAAGIAAGALILVAAYPMLNLAQAKQKDGPNIPKVTETLLDAESILDRIRQINTLHLSKTQMLYLANCLTGLAQAEEDYRSAKQQALEPVSVAVAHVQDTFLRGDTPDAGQQAQVDKALEPLQPQAYRLAVLRRDTADAIRQELTRSQLETLRIALQIDEPYVAEPPDANNPEIIRQTWGDLGRPPRGLYHTLSVEGWKVDRPLLLPKDAALPIAWEGTSETRTPEGYVYIVPGSYIKSLEKQGITRFPNPQDVQKDLDDRTKEDDPHRNGTRRSSLKRVEGRDMSVTDEDAVRRFFLEPGQVQTLSKYLRLKVTK